MATKNKKDIVTDLLANIYANTTKDIRAVMVRVPFSDLINSVSANITIAQLRLENDSADNNLVNIIDPGKQGIFYYDSLDNIAADDGSCCIVITTGKRYKRLIQKEIDARWYGKANVYFDQLSDATTAIQSFTRFVGLQITVIVAGSLSTYWFRDGIADGDLIEKNPETHPLDFTVGDGGATTPADLATDFIDSRILNKTIMGFWIGGAKTKVVVSPATIGNGNIYGQYFPTLAKLTIKNATYNQDTDYSILYK